ncbi:uncharacterized protein LOC117641794 isoform X2 [Thrips palmi]|uniref:Uncharacterized protein LOC117641794 isoform X2 n=1 Tax=Thrips palmi TaxID=161013 RepID=A0A6P8YMS3_THRPL|nr:uncharacterized protein LOC117641794 isoform X2 [Thrips palmi]
MISRIWRLGLSLLPYAVTRINVDAEIAQNRARKELKRQIEEHQLVFDDQTEDQINIPDLPKPTICAFPPSRQFFHPDRSLRTFNCDSLTTEKLGPSKFFKCSSENADEFFSWVRSKFKTSDDDLQRQYLQYLWLLMSCHPNEFIVQNCYDLLIEYNSCWKLTFEEVVLVFYNWGASPSDFVSEHDIESIISNLDCSILISPVNVEKVSENTLVPVKVVNVQKVLQVLSYQLSCNNLEGSQSCKKSIFILLTLLVLDKNYYSCLSSVHACLEHLANSQTSPWIAEYCESLLQTVSHHAEVAFLSECVVPECMRWCLCVAHCQQVFSLQQTFVADSDPLLLMNILLGNFDTFLKLESWELYSLVSIVDSGLSQVVSFETDHDIKCGFLDWLNQFMERKFERRTPDIDVDATLIVQLVSRLQAEWESTWVPEPSVPLDADLVVEKADADSD